jgi:hypothetical protein
MQPSKSP